MLSFHELSAHNAKKRCSYKDLLFTLQYVYTHTIAVKHAVKKSQKKNHENKHLLLQPETSPIPSIRMTTPLPMFMWLSPVLVADGGQKLSVFSPLDCRGRAWNRTAGRTVEYRRTARHHYRILWLQRQLQFWHTWNKVRGITYLS